MEWEAARSHVRVLQVMGVAVALRLALRDYTSVLQGRMELSTPLSSYERLVEGSVLLGHGLNPYAGNLVHHSPLSVFLHNAIDPYMSDFMWTLAYICMDVAIAVNLAAVVKPYRQGLRRVNHTEDDDGKVMVLVCIAYLMNPYTILSMLSRSSIIISNLAVSFAIRGAMKGSVLVASCALAVATYETVYPVVLAPLLAVMLNNLYQKSGVIFGGLTIAMTMLLLGVSIFLVGDHDFIMETYGAIFLVPELKANLGLFWYFFLEVFDHYRSFFLVVFHSAFASFAIPVVLHFRHRPLVGIFLLLGGIRIFKSYPAVGDNTIHFALLPIFGHFVKESRHLHIFFIILAVCSVLGPVFIYLWLYPGSANANFPYALGLVLTYAHGSILSDVLMLSKFEDYYIVFGRKGISGHKLTLVKSGTPRIDPPGCTTGTPKED